MRLSWTLLNFAHTLTSSGTFFNKMSARPTPTVPYYHSFERLKQHTTALFVDRKGSLFRLLAPISLQLPSAASQNVSPQITLHMPSAKQH